MWGTLDKLYWIHGWDQIFTSSSGGYNINQESYYSGHKRDHCLVYLTVTSPDGFILYLHGSEVDHRHDITLYRQSGLDAALQLHNSIVGEQFYVVADSAIIMIQLIRVSFNRTTATP